MRHLELDWEEICAKGAIDAVGAYRGSEPSLLRLRFEKLPWTTFILCSPKDHILGMHRELVSLTHGRWLTSLIKSERIREAFVEEHRIRGVSPAKIPAGLYAYGSGDKAEPASSRLGEQTGALCGYWYESFLVPQSVECEDVLCRRLDAAICELGWFLIRPAPDESLGEKGNYLNAVRCNRDFLLFESGARQWQEAGPLLMRAVELAERGELIARDSLEYETSYFGKCVFPTYSDQGIRLAVWRARLIRLLRWPLFCSWACKALAEANMNQDSIEQIRRVTRDMQYDIVVELKSYIAECKMAYPTLFEDPFLDVWKSKLMPREY